MVWWSRAVLREGVYKYSSTKENFDCFVHFVRRTVWSINPFVVMNQHERKTFTGVLYNVQNNNKIQRSKILSHAISIRDHKERCAVSIFCGINFRIFWKSNVTSVSPGTGTRLKFTYYTWLTAPTLFKPHTPRHWLNVIKLLTASQFLQFLGRIGFRTICFRILQSSKWFLRWHPVYFEILLSHQELFLELPSSRFWLLGLSSFASGMFVG